MPQTNQQLFFYVLSLDTSGSLFSLVNYRTETPILLGVPRSRVSSFLRDNDPTHPFLHQENDTMTLTPLQDKSEYLKSYTLYYNGYNHPYGVTDNLDFSKNTSDFGSFSYVVGDNDLVTNTVTHSVSDSDSTSGSLYAGVTHRNDKSDNDIPYISGRIGHSGD
jgi:hypothetical protein